MVTREVVRAKEWIGIQTALCGPLVLGSNLLVVRGPLGPVYFTAVLCLAIGIGLFFGANNLTVDEDQEPERVTSVLGCKTCHDVECVACDRHFWITKHEDDGWV